MRLQKYADEQCDGTRYELLKKQAQDICFCRIHWNDGSLLQQNTMQKRKEEAMDRDTQTDTLNHYDAAT